MRLRPSLGFVLVLLICGTGFSWGSEKKSQDKPKTEEKKAAEPVAADFDPDANGDGVVDAEEKRKALEHWSQAEEKPAASADEKAVEAKADVNKDGVVEPDEKRKLMQEWAKDDPAAAVKKSIKKGE